MGRTMLDARDLEASLKAMMKRKGIKSWFSTAFDACDFEEIIYDTPAVEIEPERRGRWIVDGGSVMAAARSNGKRWITATCSECKTLGSPIWKRCPVCEARMYMEEAT